MARLLGMPRQIKQQKISLFTFDLAIVCSIMLLLPRVVFEYGQYENRSIFAKCNDSFNAEE